jgi:staphyloferrin B biosynthesis citrate synthase
VNSSSGAELGPVNPVITRLREGGVALGMPIRIGRASDIVRVARTTGHDFLFIDTQHALFGLETLGHLAQAALGSGVAALVRVRGVADPDVAVLLDNGISGVVFPDVESAEEARAAVRVAKFPPAGARGVKSGYPEFDYRGTLAGPATAWLNSNTLVICMIESPAGVDKIEEIMAVDGVDGIHIGVHDLLYSIGAVGQLDHPTLRAAQERAVSAAATLNKFAGCGGVTDLDEQRRLIEVGIRFITTQSDLGFLLASARAWTSALR